MESGPAAARENSVFARCRKLPNRKDACSMRPMRSKTRRTIRSLSTKILLLSALFVGLGLCPHRGQGQQVSSSAELHPAGLYNSVANPKAVVILGSARFTVLAPKLVRMEWEEDGKFEDHASFVFVFSSSPHTCSECTGDCGNRPPRSRWTGRPRPQRCPTLGASLIPVAGQASARFRLSIASSISDVFL